MCMCCPRFWNMWRRGWVGGKSKVNRRTERDQAQAVGDVRPIASRFTIKADLKSA